MSELKRLVEALLFAAAKRLDIVQIAKLCRASQEDVLAVLHNWKRELDESQSSTMLIEENGTWRLTVREKYIPVIKKVVTKTELPKSILETLAVVAYKAPVLQSKVVGIRTNKAYDHLNYLENAGFVTREKSGRTKLIKLTPKFFEYFDVDPAKLKGRFQSLGEIESAIEAKEKEIAQMEVETRDKAAQNLEAPQIVLDGKPLEQFTTIEPVEELLPTGVEIYEEKLGELPVVDIDEVQKQSNSKVRKVQESVSESIEVRKQTEPEVVDMQESTVQAGEPKETKVTGPETEKKSKQVPKRKGLFAEGLPEGMQKRIDERIEELLNPKKDES